MIGSDRTIIADEFAVDKALHIYLANKFEIDRMNIRTLRMTQYDIFLLFEGRGDRCTMDVNGGCPELLLAVQNRVRPKFHVYGHIHEGLQCSPD